MISFLKNLWTTHRAKKQAQAELTDKIRRLMDMEDDIDEGWNEIVSRPAVRRRELQEDVSGDEGSLIINTLNRNDGVGWEIIGSAYKGHVAQDQQVMVAQARRMFRFDQNAQASVFGLMEYIVGTGVTITPKSKDPRIWKLWREFWTSDRNRMGLRQYEIVKMFVRDGEVFVRFFNKDDQDKATWKTTVRFMDPIDVRRAAKEEVSGVMTDKMSQGITYDPDDAEKPLKYYMRDRIDLGKEIEVDADDVLHVKFPVSDIDQARGESALQSVMRLFTQYKKWLDARMVLNQLRTAIFAVREIETGTGGKVSTLTQTLPTSSRGGGSGDSKKRSIRPGTIATMPPGVKLRMESPNINASDVKDDGRNIILGMAAGTGLPEYMYGDASNANYSSTAMAESPFIRRVMFLRTVLDEALWKPMFRRVIENAVEAGMLEAPPEEDIFAEPDDQQEPKDKPLGEDMKPGDFSDPSEDSGEEEVEKDLASKPGSLDNSPISESETELFYGCDTEWTQVIHRDPKEEAEALSVARTNGWVSDKTASERLGFDYAEEVRKQRTIQEDAEANGNPLAGHEQGAMASDAEEKGGLSQMDAEMQDHFKGMAPADQQSILAMKDPQQIADAVGKHMKSKNGKQKVAAGEEQ